MVLLSGPGTNVSISPSRCFTSKRRGLTGTGYTLTSSATAVKAPFPSTLPSRPLFDASATSFTTSGPSPLPGPTRRTSPGGTYPSAARNAYGQARVRRDAREAARRVCWWVQPKARQRPTRLRSAAWRAWVFVRVCIARTGWGGELGEVVRSCWMVCGGLAG